MCRDMSSVPMHPLPTLLFSTEFARLQCISSCKCCCNHYLPSPWKRQDVIAAIPLAEGYTLPLSDNPILIQTISPWILSVTTPACQADQGFYVPASLQILDTKHKRHLEQCTVNRKRKQSDEAGQVELDAFDKLEAEELEYDLRFGHRVNSIHPCQCHATSRLARTMYGILRCASPIANGCQVSILFSSLCELICVCCSKRLTCCKLVAISASSETLNHHGMMFMASTAPHVGLPLKSNTDHRSESDPGPQHVSAEARRQEEQNRENKGAEAIWPCGLHPRIRQVSHTATCHTSTISKNNIQFFVCRMDCSCYSLFAIAIRYIAIYVCCIMVQAFQTFRGSLA